MAEGNVKSFLRRIRGTGGENGSGGNDSQLGPIVVVPSEAAGEEFGVTFAPGTEVEVKNDSGNPLTVDGSGVTQPVSATSLPLPAGAATEAKQDTLNGKLPDESGTWGYSAGASGTVNVPANKRLLGITATGATSAASMTINGGDSITIPANQAVEFNPRANLVAPTIVFTGTAAYIVEFVE